MRFPCLPSSALSCLSDSTLSASSPPLPRFRPAETQLTLASASELPPLIRAFSGRAGESCSNFVYKLTLLVDALHRNKNEHRKVLVASLYLDGDALGWFRGLLRTNAETFIVAENARRAHESPTATALYLDPVNPIYWTQYPFVTVPLASLDDFLVALSAKFGEQGKAPGPGLTDDSPYVSRAGGSDSSNASRTPRPVKARPLGSL